MNLLNPTERRALSRQAERQPGPPGFFCPEQDGRTASCATCAACWQSDKPVWFRAH